MPHSVTPTPQPPSNHCFCPRPPNAPPKKTCTLGADGRCIKVAQAVRIKSAAAAPSAVNVDLDLLVVILGFTGGGACNKGYAMDVASVQDMYLGSAGYANFFRNCSYGMWGINRSKFKVGA